MKEFTVTAECGGRKLKAVLKKEFPCLGDSEIRKALRKKDIRVNGVKVSENQTLGAGDVVRIYCSDAVLGGCAEPSVQGRIIYEDANLIAVDKPVGIETEGAASLASALSAALGYEVFPCHRLDRNTKGIILFAKTEELQRRMFDRFRAGEIQKKYAALVWGIPKDRHAVLKAYLFKDAKNSFVRISRSKTPGSKEIVTEYEILSSDREAGTSLLSVSPHTGRTHQIRAHLAYAGYPIIGDGKYGINEVNRRFRRKYQSLQCYGVSFLFETPDGATDYLKNKTIEIELSP